MDPDAAVVVTQAPPEVRSGRDTSDVVAVFAVMWAAATLFHVWGPSGRAVDLFSHVTTAGVLQALAGAAAVAVLLQPRSIGRLGVLAALGLSTIWFEAPVLGSHWVVAGFVNLTVLLALAATRSAHRLEEILVPLLRWVYVGFYSFAAFAKLNHAFFTPSVSCGTYYLDELAQSLGISLHSATAGGWSHLVPFVVAGTELMIPVLLLVRRTRHIGVLTGLLFHGVIALDQTHLFSDFSSVLTPLFVSFLPAAFASDVVRRYRSLGHDQRERIYAAIVVGSALLLVAQWYGRSATVQRLYNDALGWAWVVYAVTVVALVVAFLRTRPERVARPLSFADRRVPRWLAIVPVLVLLNGLSPYLELRTAYSFNMYANLVTADGESNHFIVTRTLPLTDYQSDPAKILATNDPELAPYAETHFAIPMLQLQDYLSRHRDSALTYERAGVVHQLARASDDPALVEPVPSWKSKFFAFRSLDETEPARCQPSFLAAL